MAVLLKTWGLERADLKDWCLTRGVNSVLPSPLHTAPLFCHSEGKTWGPGADRAKEASLMKDEQRLLEAGCRVYSCRSSVRARQGLAGTRCCSPEQV